MCRSRYKIDNSFFVFCSCGSSPGLVSNFSSPVCDGGLIQARKCQDANSCGECLANWPVHRGQGHLCKWCTKCKTGAYNGSKTGVCTGVRQDISEKPEVIDASYPWYQGAGVYKKIHPGLYLPVFRANMLHGG